MSTPKPKPPVNDGFVRNGKVVPVKSLPRDKQGFPLTSSNDLSQGEGYYAFSDKPTKIPSLNSDRTAGVMHYGNPAGWLREAWSAISGGDIKNKVNDNYSLAERKKLGKIMALRQSREAVTGPDKKPAMPGRITTDDNKGKKPYIAKPSTPIKVKKNLGAM